MGGLLGCKPPHVHVATPIFNYLRRSVREAESAWLAALVPKKRVQAKRTGMQMRSVHIRARVRPL